MAGRGVLAGGDEQIAGLVVADRRRPAFAALGPGALDALDRVVGDRVSVAEVFEERGQRRQAVPDGGAAEPTAREVVAPGDDVRSGDGAKFLRVLDAGEADEVADRLLVGAPAVRVRDVGEPLGLGRHVGQPPELGGSQIGYQE